MNDFYIFWSICLETGYLIGKFTSEYIYDHSDNFLEAYSGCESERNKCKKN